MNGDGNKARRISAEARREQLLETACDIVRSQGLSSCTLEEVASRAGVSKPLVYKHFANRDDMLRAMFAREMVFIRRNGINTTPPDTPFAALHRIHVTQFLEYLRERGSIFHALTNDPGIDHLMEKGPSAQRAEIRRFFGDAAKRAFHVPDDIAALGTSMTIAALNGAEHLLRQQEIDLDRVVEFWLTFMIAGWSAVGASYSVQAAQDYSHHPLGPGDEA